MYLPSLIPIIIKCVKLLPLWSGLMIPLFGYGSETASSAAVESSFNKIKNTTFKHISLPTDLEIFLEHHIASLRGSSLLRSCQQPSSSLDRIDETVISNESYQIDDIHEADAFNYSGDDNIQHMDQLNHTDDYTQHMDRINHEDGMNQTDDLDLMCSFNVHNNTERSNILTEEDMSVESWRRRPKTLQKSRSYLYPNSTL